MTTDLPTFSIVMPAYNAAVSVARAIESVRAQSITTWELIVVDDCSTDDTAAVVTRLLHDVADSRIRLVRQPTNSGVAVARNVGVEQARGVFVTFLDSDDEYLPAHLATMADAFGPEVDAVVGGREVVRADGSVTSAASRRIGTFSGEEAVRVAMLDGLTPFPWDKAFRRVLFESVRFPEGVARFEDMMTNIVLYSHARQVVALDTPTYRYFISGGSLTWGSVPTPADTATVWDYLDSSLNPDLRTGPFESPYRAMRTLVSLLVAQSAIAQGRDKGAVRSAVRLCRDEISLRDVAATLRSAPRLGVAAILLKALPDLYGWLYLRHVHQEFGVAAG